MRRIVRGLVRNLARRRLRRAVASWRKEQRLTSRSPGTCSKRLWLLRSRPDQVHRAAMRGGPSESIVGGPVKGLPLCMSAWVCALYNPPHVQYRAGAEMAP